MQDRLHSPVPITDPTTPSTKNLQSHYIKELASRKIQAFQGTIDEHGEYLDPVYQSNRSLAESIASDYRDRFLIELIQNAYDAQPIGTPDGEIQITLDRRRGEHGTLFVANRGSPFSGKDVKALCDIGLSQKPLGEAIGNKGLGFRSVVQVTDTPRIYSQEPAKEAASAFYGFCFRFAGPDDYPEMIDHELHAKLARRDLPIFHVPIPVDGRAEYVAHYAKAGYTTVVELPLRDRGSFDDVHNEITRIRDQKLPILLFLNRVSSLNALVIDEAGRTATECTFSRFEEPLTDADVDLFRVDLGDAGVFAVARGSVSEDTMKHAITKGIARKELNEYWERWSGEGEVALAVQLDHVPAAPRLYTFLPMGDDATAPFSGYLHGTFCPSSNRKSLNAKIGMNEVLLTEATMLAARTIHRIATDPTGAVARRLTDEERSTAVVDLLCWHDVNSIMTDKNLAADLVRNLPDRFGSATFDESPVVPCTAPGSEGLRLTWKPPTEVRRWPTGSNTFGAHVATKFAHQTNVWPIPEELGPRIEMLHSFLSVHSVGFAGEPLPTERAEFVSLVARKLRTTPRTPKSEWLSYYSEIPDFMGEHAEQLAGKPIMLGEDGELHAAMALAPPIDADGARARRRRRMIVAAVFSPPDPRRAGHDEDLEVVPPKRLADRFTFLRTAFPWHAELSKTRTYFEQHDLVEEFDRVAVLTHVSRTLQQENNKEVLRIGLRWAFQLWRQPRDGGQPVRLQPQHRFRVPTLSGEYVPASKAVFSAGWPTSTTGALLQEFLDAAPSGLADLEGLARRRLANPNHPAFRGRWIDDWTIFLTELGVKAGLNPEPRSTNTKTFPAKDVSDFSFVADYEIPVEFGKFWRRDILARDPSLVVLPSYTDYVIQGDLWWLPGQADTNHFSARCTELYARLIVKWLSGDSGVTWDITVHHLHYRYADRRTWPNPLTSFLQSERWLPADGQASSSDQPVGVRPCDVWIRDTGGDRFEPYLRRPAQSLRRDIERAPDQLIERLVKRCGLHVFGDPSSLSEQLEFLALQYARRDFNSYYEAHLFNLYSRSWEEIAKSVDGQQRGFEQDRPAVILAQSGHERHLIQMSDGGGDQAEPVYICDTNKESDAHLLEASGRLFVFLRDADGEELGALFETYYGDRVRRLSQVEYTLLADGENIRNSVTTSVVSICPQLRAMVAVAMEALSGTEAQRLPTDRSTILTKLERLNVVKARSLRFVIDGTDVLTSPDTIRAFHFRLDVGAAIVAVQASEDWSWELVDSGVPAICDALGQRALVPHLRLLIAHLRHEEPLQQAIQAPPSPSEHLGRFSGLLQLSASASRAAGLSLSAGVERHVPWIRAVLHHMAGPAAVEEFDRLSDDALQDVGLFEKTLAKLLDSPECAKALLAICRTAIGPKDFRQGLKLGFRDFNASLIAVGADPDTYPDLHQSRLQVFLRENAIDIADCLRESCADRLAKMEPVEGYAATRDSLRELRPDPAWLDIFEEPPTAALVDHVNAWLADKHAPPLGCHDGLEPLAEVREHNQLVVHRFQQKAMPLVRAWCTRFEPGNAIRSLAEASGPNALQQRLDNAGVFDFRKLDDIPMMKWLRVFKIWPTSMPQSLDLEILGLSKSDLTAERTKAREAQEARKREERSIVFNGRPVDPINADLLSLSMELRDGLSPTVLERALGAASSLAVLQPSSTTRRKRRTGGSGSGGRPRVPDEKTELIGRLGEFTVYHWLRRRLPNQDVHAAWRSENGRLITGHVGDDSLGFDFEVSYRNQIWQIEVKASLSDPQTFEMGESEVRAARAAARPRSGVQYKIAYVSNVSDTTTTMIEMLPSPMTDEGARVFQLLGGGIRYIFSRSLP